MPPKRYACWLYFDCIKKNSNSGMWAKCKKCGHELQGIIERMKKHTNLCESNDDDLIGTDGNLVKKQKTLLSQINISKDSNIISTSSVYKKKIDKAIAKYFVATNTPFLHADHVMFKHMCEILRPEYTPPSSLSLGNELINDVHDDVLEECKLKFNGKTVTMELDGWSNVHNEPIVCVSIVDSEGNNALVSTIDTSGNQHTSEYLQSIAEQEIEKCENNFQVTVGSFVTDNAGNVSKMRKNLQNNPNLNILQYGCNAHILNLLSKDILIPQIGGHVIKIIKYFRNTHLPAAWYKQAGGKQLIMPVVVRWNSICDSIDSFLKNRGVLIQVCQDKKNEIGTDIYKMINDNNLANTAEDFRKRMKPIAIAVDRAQRDCTTISIVVEVWKKLEKDLGDQPINVRSAFLKRMDMALSPVHYLANMIDHRLRGKNLTEEEKSKGYEYLIKINPDLLPILMCHCAGSAPFKSYLYEKSLRTMPPIIWWSSVNVNSSNTCFNWEILKDQWLTLCNQVLSAIASTARIERIFSTFSLVQSKLRNRLGNEKAGKLTFAYKYLNSNKNIKKKSRY